MNSYPVIILLKGDSKMKKIVILSRKEAVDMLADASYNEKVGSVVSICGPRESHPKEVSQSKKDKVVLELKFDDINNQCKRLIEKGMFRGGNDYLPPEKKHIQAIIDHAEEILDTDKIIICHCQAGVSRSAAAAYILKCIDLGKGKEREALLELLKNRDYISPNDLMIDLAQNILGDEWDLKTPLNNLNELKLESSYKK